MKAHKQSGIQLSLAASASILCLATILLLPTLAGFFTDHQARSSWEKRALAAWPSVSANQQENNYFDSLEEFIDDHIGFALELNRLYRKLKFYVYRDNPVPNIVVGSNGLVFLGSHNQKNPHATLQALCQEETRSDRQQSIKDGIGLLAWSAIALELRPSFAIFPSKPILYPEALPVSVPETLRNACLGFAQRANFPSQLAASRPQHIYYPLAAFQALKSEPHFYPPGNFHAQGRSAHEFARGLLNMLDISPGDNFDQDPVLTNTHGDLQAMGFIYHRPVWHYSYDSFGITRQDEQPSLVLRYYPLATDFAHFKSAHPASERVALLLTNSFGAFVAPHLAPGFREVFQININDLDPLQTRPLIKALLDHYAITDVIYLVHDTALINGFKLTQLSQALQEHAIEVLSQ